VADEERPCSLYRDEDETTPTSVRPAASGDFLRPERDWLTRRGDLPSTPTYSQGLRSQERLNPALATIRQPSSSRERTRLAPETYWPSLEQTNQNHDNHITPDSTSRNNSLGIAALAIEIAELEGSPVSVARPRHFPRSNLHTIENQSNNPNYSNEIDEDEQSLAQAIEISLRTPNRYTVGGTNLEELQQALIHSQFEQ
jgi:hypothetical protein